MSTLTGKRISATYKGLLKTSDETILSETPKAITDGDGNSSGVFLDTGGNLKVNNTVEFGSLKDNGEDITIEKFVDEADGIANNDNDTSLPTSAAVKDYVDTKITAEDLDFSGNSGTGDVDLDSEVFAITGSNGITTTALDNTLDIDGSTLQTAINTNASDIATNAADIATNTADISTNAGNIATNTADIATNASDIATNASAISTNQSNIANNTLNIANNATNIATNTANITTNAANIASNDTDITNLQADVATNTGNIATNTSNISGNTADIATNAGNIATNATNISTNATNIASNDTDIAALQTDVSTNTTNIATNATAISANATDIATNAGNISTNATAISTNSTNIATNTADITDLQNDKVAKAGDTMTGTLTMDEAPVILNGDDTNVNSRNFGIYNGQINPGELNILVSDDATTAPSVAPQRNVTIDERGWVGIGVSPVDELHIDGNLRMNKLLKLDQVNQNTFAGALTGNLPNITGAKNVGFGRGVLNTATTANSNTAVGFNALNTTNANHNTAVGHEAASSNTSGSFNVVMGSNAHKTASTGSSCVVIGADAQSLGNPGNSNVAIGRQALETNSAANNVGVGRAALQNNANSPNNVAVGSYALSAGNTPAHANNTAVGNSAGYNNQGRNNVFLGSTSLGSTATANNEVTLGNSSTSVLRCAVTTITSLSDERDKTDIKPLEYGLDFVNALQPKEFVWDNRPEYGVEIDDDGNETTVELENENKGKKDFGFIAQEVKELDNDTLRLVYSENPEKLEMSYGKLVPILVKAIQELTAEVEALKS